MAPGKKEKEEGGLIHSNGFYSWFSKKWFKVGNTFGKESDWRCVSSFNGICLQVILRTNTTLPFFGWLAALKQVCAETAYLENIQRAQKWATLPDLRSWQT